MKKLLSAFVSVLMLMSLSCAGETSADDQAEEDLASAATADTRFSAEDGALLQSYLLGRPVETDLSGKNYDLNGNGRWDVFDLCLLKEQIEAQPAEEPQSDTIVVYFSRTGNTEKIADYLLEITGADSYVIQAAVPYSDEDIAYNNSSCRADQEQNDKTVRPEIADRKITDAWDEFLVGIPTERLDCLAALRDRYKLYLLSNTNRCHWTLATNDLFLYHGLTVDYYFEKIYLSYKMGMLKPESAIFEAAIKDAGIKPAETLFIDDSEANCQTAAKLGLRTFHSTAPGDWMKLFQQEDQQDAAAH